LNLLLTNKEELVRDAKVGGRLGCSVHEMVEFRVLRGGNEAKMHFNGCNNGTQESVVWPL